MVIMVMVVRAVMMLMMLCQKCNGVPALQFRVEAFPAVPMRNRGKITTALLLYFISLYGKLLLWLRQRCLSIERELLLMVRSCSRRDLFLSKSW